MLSIFMLYMERLPQLKEPLVIGMPSSKMENFTSKTHLILVVQLLEWSQTLNAALHVQQMERFQHGTLTTDGLNTVSHEKLLLLNETPAFLSPNAQ
ncbi:hypothetical protein NPIL_520571 [Nephila pilipes]|uniref:Uncharacterized protein n=1 Tax=Nephila pilipes TaxID=299642 RepID=A0A8X6UGS8_NEPPI|nr:hypothetical protein NPIL_520571 [Nephila pilipes]